MAITNQFYRPVPESLMIWGPNYDRERQRFEEATAVTFHFPKPKPPVQEKIVTAPIFGTLPTTKPTAKTAPTLSIRTAEELREALNKGFVEVTFTKETGEQVTLKATTDLSHVPKMFHPAPKAPTQSIQGIVSMPSPQFVGEAQKPKDPNHITFFSPDRNGWRSLRFERLIQAFVI